MALQLAANGSRTRDDHPAVPLDADALVRDAVACAALGVTSVHLHPRDDAGLQTLDPVTTDTVVRAVRAASGLLVGVSTQDGIEPDPARRVALVARWREPDFASVNTAEDGWEDVIRALTANGIGIEAGLSTAEDAERLIASALAGTVLRCIVEPYGDEGSDAALARCAAIHAVLDAGDVLAPRLQHADEAATWPVLRDAIGRGHDTRVGLEDVLELPDGTVAEDNVAIVRAAGSIGADRDKQ